MLTVQENPSVTLRSEEPLEPSLIPTFMHGFSKTTLHQHTLRRSTNIISNFSTSSFCFS